jgi:hypothetical protein
MVVFSLGGRTGLALASGIGLATSSIIANLFVVRGISTGRMGRSHRLAPDLIMEGQVCGPYSRSIDRTDCTGKGGSAGRSDSSYRGHSCGLERGSIQLSLRGNGLFSYTLYAMQSGRSDLLSASTIMKA